MLINDVLIKLVSMLEKHNLNWALGGSFALKLNNINISPNDIDIWVSSEDMPIIRKIFDTYTQVECNGTSLSSDIHYKISIDNIEVDFITSTEVKTFESTYYYTPALIDKLYYKDTEIKVVSLEDCFIIYTLLGRANKSKKIEKQILDNRTFRKEIFERYINNHYSQNIDLVNTVKKIYEECNQTLLIPSSAYTNGKIMFPSLRIILTNKCNGKCKFCHSEGEENSNADINMSIIEQAAKAAKYLHLNKITLTGGEPTYRNDLIKITRTIKAIYPEVKLNITTNGFKIPQFIEAMPQYFDKVHLSISSLNPEIYSQYQNVDPIKVINCLQKFNKEKVIINIVITDDNINELIDITDYFTNNGYSVVIMFDLSKKYYKLNDQAINELIKKYGDFYIKYSTIPLLCNRLPNGTTIKIKHS